MAYRALLRGVMIGLAVVASEAERSPRFEPGHGTLGMTPGARLVGIRLAGRGPGCSEWCGDGGAQTGPAREKRWVQRWSDWHLILQDPGYVATGGMPSTSYLTM